MLEVISGWLTRILYPFGYIPLVDSFFGPFLCLAVYFLARMILRRVPVKRAGVLEYGECDGTVVLEVTKQRVLNFLGWLLDLRIVLHMVRYFCKSMTYFEDGGKYLTACGIATILCVVVIAVSTACCDDGSNIFIFCALFAIGALTVADWIIFFEDDMSGSGIPGWPFWAIPVLFTAPRIFSYVTHMHYTRFLGLSGRRFKKNTYWTERTKHDHHVEHPLTSGEAAALEHALGFAAGQEPDLGGTWTVSMTNDRYAAYLSALTGKIGREGRGTKLFFVPKERPLMLRAFQPEAIRQTYAALGLQRQPDQADYEQVLGAVNAYGDYLAGAIGPEQKALAEAYDTECQIIGRGLRGEDRVFRAVNALKERVPGLRSLENFRVQYSGGSAETDLLIVCQQGVFCLEIKNYNEGGEGNYQLVVHPDGSWYKLYGDQQLHPIEGSPFSQNAIHAAAIREVFAAELRDGASGVTDLSALVRPAVVLGSDVPVTNQSAYPLLHPETIYSYISQFPAVFSEEKVERLWQAMSARALEALPFQHPALAERQKRLDELQAELETLVVLQKELRLSEKYRVFDT